MTIQIRITDPMKVVMAIRVTTTNTTHEPEGGARRLKELRNPLPWRQDKEERTLYPTGTGYTHRTAPKAWSAMT